MVCFQPFLTPVPTLSPRLPQEEGSTQPLNLSARSKTGEPHRSPSSPSHTLFPSNKTSPITMGKGRIPSPLSNMGRGSLGGCSEHTHMPVHTLTGTNKQNAHKHLHIAHKHS